MDIGNCHFLVEKDVSLEVDKNYVIKCTTKNRHLNVIIFLIEKCCFQGK